MTNHPWLKSSIMAKRGVARGELHRRHELSIAAQGAFHYVYGPYVKPVLTIDPGDVVAVETEDAFGGVITSEQDSPTAKLKFPYLNPQCGPIAELSTAGVSTCAEASARVACSERGFAAARANSIRAPPRWWKSQ